MRTVVFDLETKNVFSDVGTNDPAALDLSVVCIWDSETDSYTHYFEEDLPKLWPILEKTDRLVGFNSEHFDIPILDKYYSGDLTKIPSVDLMRSMKEAIGRRIKLDTIAAATLGKKKIGHGLEAITWWKNKELDKLVKYCIEDVRITKELFDYALANKKLKYRDNLGALQEAAIDTSNWGETADHRLTHTLPW